MSNSSQLQEVGGHRVLLSDRIREALTEAIASGELSPGAALDEQVIADRYNVSRTPVREAFRELAVAGLIEIRPRRGAIVTPISFDRVMDLFEAMTEVEAVCIRLATYRMNPLERTALMRIHELSGEFARAGDVLGYLKMNRKFHEALYEGTHNIFLVEQATGIRSRLDTLRHTHLYKAESLDEAKDRSTPVNADTEPVTKQMHRARRLEHSHLEHGQMLATMARGEGEEAARQMRAHMFNASGSLADYFNDPA